MKAFLMRRPFALLAVLMLAACAGGGETGTGITPINGNGKDVSVGTITAFGSVWVNGVEFETPATQVTFEGAASSTNALRLGMVVTVKGTINADRVSGTADAILVETAMTGPVESFAALTSTLTVLGQTVLVNAATKLDGLILANLNPGDIVEVSGVVKSAGVIVATRIELKGPTEEYKLEGIVTDANPGNRTFMIGFLLVNHAGLNGLVPADGMLVEVEGTISSGIFIATQLEAEKLEVEDADTFEMEGFVASVASGTGGVQFSVNNVTVQTSAQTVFEGGLPAALINGMYVKVEGPLAGGIVLAAKVEIKNNVTLEANRSD